MRACRLSNVLRVGGEVPEGEVGHAQHAGKVYREDVRPDVGLQGLVDQAGRQHRVSICMLFVAG